MLSFVQSWFAPSANAVGVDFGTDTLRLAQVEKINGDFRLIAAASASVPADIRNDPAGRLAFFTRTLRELWPRGNFRGRRAVLALPAAHMHIQHLRLPRMDEVSLKKAIPWEARGKLPYEPSQALIRHLVAGDVYSDDEPRTEVILMAARSAFVEELLAAATGARLEVIAMTVEPRAMIDCFLNVYRRKSDTAVTNCFLDMGCSASRVVIAHGGQILFARAIPIGGEMFNQAMAAEMKVSVEEAKRERFAQIPGTVEEPSTPPEAVAGERRVQNRDEVTGQPEVPSALSPPLSQLIDELVLCRRYYESTFPNRPVKRLIFFGGEARQRALCQTIARELGIAAQVGDPLVRMGRTAEISPESGIDRRLPQPAWAVAIGLSMGAPVLEPARP